MDYTKMKKAEGYHKSNVGYNDYYTRHPQDDMEYYETIKEEEFPGAGIVTDGEYLYLVDDDVSSMKEEGEIDIWRGTKYQDREGYRYEIEGGGLNG